MKDLTLPEVILASVLVFAACGLLERGATTQSPVLTHVPTLEATESLATESPVAIQTPVLAATAGLPMTGVVTIQVSRVATLGQALVDGQGRSLYLFIGGQYSSPAPCAGEECLEEWLPLLANGDPVVGAGLDAGKIGTLTLADGTRQVTYNSSPLYYFNQDTTPGEAKGQGDDGEWYLVSPSGEALKSQ